MPQCALKLQAPPHSTNATLDAIYGIQWAYPEADISGNHMSYVSAGLKIQINCSSKVSIESFAQESSRALDRARRAQGE